MSNQSEASIAELFGLAGTFPQPGWVLLDALRDHRFTGELIVETTSTVRLYSDRGDIYLAERASDPSIGNRLVDAGALTAIELEQGSIEIDDTVHLGRLFERVPSVDRHRVLVTAELMTDECVGWLAARTVSGAVSTPYRHHESGIHRWSRSPGWIDLSPGDPLPAPLAEDEPVEVEPPADEPVEGLAAGGDRFDDGADDGLQGGVEDRVDDGVDDVIEWNEPSWLDLPRYQANSPEPATSDRVVQLGAPEPATSDRAVQPGAPDDEAPRPVFDSAPREGTDWVDRLEADGLPDQPDLLAAPTPLPRMPIEANDRFELIWPTGEIDEEFGALDEVVGGEHDRVGSTARLVGIDHRDIETPDSLDQDGEPTADEAAQLARNPGADEALDEVVLAVRRAVASIEVGSLAARQRLVDATDSHAGSRGVGAPAPTPVAPEPSTAAEDTTQEDTATPPAGSAVAPDEVESSPEPVSVETIDGVLAPGRVAVRSGRNDWSRRTVTRSVFDEPMTEPEPRIEESPADDDDDDHHARRTGALRRLISSLRR